MTKMGGFFKKYENLNFAIIHAAGHLVPATQLAITRSMVKDMISSTHSLECHSEDLNELPCFKTETQCEFMNNCNGNGNCQKGRCLCNSGYYTADCSVSPEKLKKSFELPA